jgi:two-component system chemotaxis sensor kinase CheA
VSVALAIQAIPMSMVSPLEFLDEFLAEARERLDEVEAALLSLGGAAPEVAPALVDTVKRGLHTLKGNSAMMGLSELRDLAHRLEDEVERLDPATPQVGALLRDLDRCRDLLDEAEASRAGAVPVSGEGEVAGSAAPTRVPVSLRVPFAALDSLVDQLAEMVIFRNRLRELVHRGRREAAAGLGNRQNWEEVERAELAVGRSLGQLQERILALRMVPLKTLFGQLRRIVHDEAARLSREVDLQVRGGDTPMDKALLEVANDALGHLVRNAVIHGIEPPAERQAAGKPRVGRIDLSAEARGGEVWIAVADDGRGIDRARLARLAAERGLPAEDPERLFDLLFVAGVTTHEGADLGAGRGMGLAAVQAAVERQSGRIAVASREGAGSRFELRLPLSVSITRALLVEADGESYAIPLSAVVESVRFDPQASHRINGAPICRWRGEVIPVLDAGAGFGSRESPAERAFVVVLEVDGEVRGFAVDVLVGIQEIVVRGLDPLVGTPKGVLGSTVLGDGRAILILDPRSLLEIDLVGGNPA